MPTVYNYEIKGLHSRINRFIMEVWKSVSSGTSQTNAADKVRLASYFDAIDFYRKWMIAQPEIDAPETHPRDFELEENPEVTDVENESSNDVIHMLQTTRDELVNSQSARLGAGLNKFDAGRLESMVTKMRNFLANYMIPLTPIDLPESSPKEESSGAGLKGI